MSDCDYELHIQRSLYDSLLEGDGLEMSEDDSEDIDKIITEELAAARRRRRRRPASR